MAKCPYCYREALTWTHDPILVPNGAAFDWSDDTHLVSVPVITDRLYRGLQQITEDEIIELQEELQDLEIEFLESADFSVFSTVNVDGKFQITGKHIKEMRDSVEKLINANGMTKSDFFNYDEEGNHIIHPNGDKTDWTDPITDAVDLQKFQVKYIHIEDLRHYIEEIWENFTKGGSGSCSSVGASPADLDNFTIQKNQLWAGDTYALVEFYNHTTWLSTSNSAASIGNTGIGSASCHANAGNGYYVGYQIYGSDARATSGLSAAIPVINYTTKFPCSKLIYNPITQVYDTYHLFIKADCSVSLSASGSYHTGPVGYTRLPPDPFTLHPNKDDWDAAPIVPNPYHTSKAEAVLTIATYQIGGGPGQYIQWVDGEYHNGEPPLGGIPVASLNNFDIDIGQAIIDTYSLAPEGYAVILFSFGCVVRGTGNSLDMKSGPAEYVPAEYPLVGYWRGPYTPTGGKGDATASFVIDNINFYYKKI